MKRISIIGFLGLLLLFAGCGGSSDTTGGEVLPHLGLTPTPGPTATPTPVPTVNPIAPTAVQNLREENYSDTLLGGTKRQCSYDIVWDPPASHPDGNGITYVYCLDRYLNGSLEVHWCGAPMSQTRWSEGTTYFPGDNFRMVSTVTPYNGDLAGPSDSFTEYCGAV